MAKSELEKYKFSLYKLERAKDEIVRKMRAEPERAYNFRDQYDRVREQIRSFKQIIAKLSNEQTISLDMLKANCSDALAVYKKTKHVLYRGDYGTTNDIVSAKSPAHREPKDSNSYLQFYYDAHCKSIGITALRSNSMFCTSNYDDALSYGEVSIVVPKNGFSFSWATKADDIILDQLAEVINTLYIKKIDELIFKKYKKKILLLDFFYDYSYDEIIKDVLPDIIPVKKDIVLFQKAFTLEKIVNKTAIKKHYNPTNKNFLNAVKSGHEVLIRGTYYTVPVRFKNSLLNSF